MHINGDHGDINYIVDGLALPQALNRVVGSEFNPGDAAFVDVIQGAYPAQYGERFATVLNISTRTGIHVERPGATFEADGGSFSTFDGTLGYHDRVGNGSVVLAVQNGSTGRGLDPPQAVSLHNQASDANQFVRYTLPYGNGGSNFVNLTLSHSYRTFQIPVATDNGQPASSDDNETQDDTFAALQFRQAIGDHGAMSFGGGYRRSQIRDFGDPLNDWIYGFALNANNGGMPTDCFNALTIPNYSNVTCANTLSRSPHVERLPVELRLRVEQPRPRDPLGSVVRHLQRAQVLRRHTATGQLFGAVARAIDAARRVSGDR